MIFCSNMEELYILKKMVAYNLFERDKLLAILKQFNDDIAIIPSFLKKEQKIIRTRYNTTDFSIRVTT